MTSFTFKPWDEFHAQMDPKVFSQYLDSVGKESVNAFRRGATTYKSGRIYRFGGGQVQASGPGEWPAKRTGALVASVNYIATAREVEVGTNVRYAAYLTYGTSKMAKRKMMKEAMEEGAKKAEGRLQKWVKWERGGGSGI